MGRAAKGEGSIFKTPTGYRGYVTINGRRKYASGAKKTEVAQKLREIKTQRDTGVLAVGRSPKLAAWIDHWLTATETKHKIKTHDGYRSTVHLYLPAWLGDITLARLSAEHLEEAYAALHAKDLSGATIYQLHSVIRASLTLAHKRGACPSTSRASSSRPRPPRRRRSRRSLTATLIRSSPRSRLSVQGAFHLRARTRTKAGGSARPRMATHRLRRGVDPHLSTDSDRRRCAPSRAVHQDRLEDRPGIPEGAPARTPRRHLPRAPRFADARDDPRVTMGGLDRPGRERRRCSRFRVHVGAPPGTADHALRGFSAVVEAPGGCRPAPHQAVHGTAHRSLADDCGRRRPHRRRGDPRPRRHQDPHQGVRARARRSEARGCRTA